MSRAGTQAEQVLITAPIGADAANIQSVLLRGGIISRICTNPAELCAGIAGECGVVVLTEEVLTGELAETLTRLFENQPPWSDIPVVLITSVNVSQIGLRAIAKLRGAGRTVSLLERPLRSVTLLATVNTLLAARRRQYQLRDLLRERDSLLSSLESRVAERTAELQRMVEEMEAFSYSVSHDLRSPLRSLSGYAQALQEDFGDQLPPGALAYLDKIARAAQRMDNLTQDVLAYTRVTRCEMAIAPVDLDSLIDDVIEQYPALGAAADCIVVERPLGRVMGHVPSLVQCFSNLLGNACKFVRDGTAPRVVVRSQRTAGRLRVMVKDNGIGIAPEDQARIFRMFERAVGKAVPGTGIGLAIVRKAVERMGGTVGVNSQLGAGAEFWLELPEAGGTEHDARNDCAITQWREAKPTPVEAPGIRS